MRTRAGILLLLGLAAGPASAQDRRAPESAPEEEIVITAPRQPAPSFQEEVEWHRTELERLRRIYEPDIPPAYSPAEHKLRMPEAVSGTEIGKPTLTERLR